MTEALSSNLDQWIKQTPYAFVAKIILCVYLLYVQVDPAPRFS